jgi:ABC-2 type transport system permease protein
VAACLEKEWIYVRRNPAQFYGLVAPLAMVFIFAGRLGSFARTGMIFPAAVAYSALGIAALAYNVLGLDASGVQFYFLAPVSLRSVFLAKNLFSFGITAVQVVLVYLVLVFTSGPPPLLVTLSTLCWIVLACLVNAAIGNMRSITAPKKIDPSKISRKQASQLSALMCIGIMVAIAGLGVGLISLGRLAAIDWLPIPVLLGLAFGAFALYLAGLNRVDALALDHRETLIEELSKAN